MISSKDIQQVLNRHSGVFDDVVSKQLEGWGASTFLVHSRETHFKIVAEWRSGSGSMHDSDYAAIALQTWHLLAEEVLELRQKLAEKGAENESSASDI